jgi:ferritin
MNVNPDIAGRALFLTESAVLTESSNSLRSADVIAKLNEQMNLELKSAMAYLAMSSVAKKMGYLGAESWLRKQYLEEMAHFQKLGEFLNDNNEVFALAPIEAQAGSWTSLADIFAAAADHEKVVTESIAALREASRTSGEHASEVFLQWYVTEQVEEEDRVQDVVARLQIAGKDAAALLSMDRELGER